MAGLYALECSHSFSVAKDRFGNIDAWCRRAKGARHGPFFATRGASTVYGAYHDGKIHLAAAHVADGAVLDTVKYDAGKLEDAGELAGVVVKGGPWTRHAECADLHTHERVACDSLFRRWHGCLVESDPAACRRRAVESTKHWRE